MIPLFAINSVIFTTNFISTKKFKTCSLKLDLVRIPSCSFKYNTDTNLIN